MSIEIISPFYHLAQPSKCPVLVDLGIFPHEQGSIASSETAVAALKHNLELSGHEHRRYYKREAHAVQKYHQRGIFEGFRPLKIQQRDRKKFNKSLERHKGEKNAGNR
jgi:hypothetical protein